jgi:hypothetical protein
MSRGIYEIVASDKEGAKLLSDRKLPITCGKRYIVEAGLGPHFRKRNRCFKHTFSDNIHTTSRAHFFPHSRVSAAGSILFNKLIVAGLLWTLDFWGWFRCAVRRGLEAGTCEEISLPKPLLLLLTIVLRLVR